MDWTANVTNVQDNLPSDVLAVSVNFTNGSDSFDNTYQIHAADYSDVNVFNDFISSELTRFVAIKDVANTIKNVVNADQPVSSTTAKVSPIELNLSHGLGLAEAVNG